MLEPNPKKRINASQALNHPFFKVNIIPTMAVKKQKFADPKLNKTIY
jgi:hypothetical protein